jgi:hypothetical protein
MEAIGEANLQQQEDERWYGRGNSLLTNLRAEVTELKEDFARYCFQSVGICSIAAGAIFNYMWINPYVGLAAVTLLPIVLATSKLGTNYYSSIHRNLGYELHLARTREIPERFRGRWLDKYKDIRWEEAMRAWRVVQSTLFERILHKEWLFRPWVYRNGFDPEYDPAWYSQKSMLAYSKWATWHPGTYLKVMQFILVSVATIALAILAFTPALILSRPAPGKLDLPGIVQNALTALHLSMSPDVQKWLGVAITGLVAVIALAVTVDRFNKDRVRRRMLEDGLLSIHSCAIVWQAVTIAHFEAVDLARKFALPSHELARLVMTGKRADAKLVKEGEARKVVEARISAAKGLGQADGAGLMGYTFWLGQEAASLATHAKRIHEWIGSRGEAQA